MSPPPAPSASAAHPETSTSLAVAPSTDAPLPLWSCGQGLGSMLAGAVVNSALLTVVWGPVLVAAAFVRADAIPLAVVAFGSHLVGLAAVMVMVVRGVRLLVRRLAIG